MVTVEVITLHRSGGEWHRPGQTYDETEHAARQKIAAGLVKRAAGPSHNAALPGPSHNAGAAESWPLKGNPVDYIAKYESVEDLSDEVRERLALARRIVSATE